MTYKPGGRLFDSPGCGSVPSRPRLVGSVPSLPLGAGPFGRAGILWRTSSTGENYPMNGAAIKPTEGYLRTVPVGNWTVVGR